MHQINAFSLHSFVLSNLLTNYCKEKLVVVSLWISKMEPHNWTTLIMLSKRNTRTEAMTNKDEACFFADQEEKCCMWETNGRSPIKPAPERGFCSASSTLVERGLYLQTPQHQQTPAEPWGRSLVKLTTREKKNPPKRCPLGVKLVFS